MATAKFVNSSLERKFSERGKLDIHHHGQQAVVKNNVYDVSGKVRISVPMRDEVYEKIWRVSLQDSKGIHVSFHVMYNGDCYGNLRTPTIQFESLQVCKIRLDGQFTPGQHEFKWNFAKLGASNKENFISYSNMNAVDMDYQMYVTFRKERGIVQPLNDENSLPSKLLSGLEEGKVTDVSVECSDGATSAHKAVLALASDKFLALVTSMDKESESVGNAIKLPNYKLATIRPLIKFLYSDHVEPEDIHPDLLIASHEFGAPNLTRICSKHLSSAVTKENAISNMVLGHKHDAKELKEAATRAIIANMASLKDTPEWTDLKKKEPEIVSEMLEDISISLVESLQ